MALCERFADTGARPLRGPVRFSLKVIPQRGGNTLSGVERKSATLNIVLTTDLRYPENTSCRHLMTRRAGHGARSTGRRPDRQKRMKIWKKTGAVMAPSRPKPKRMANKRRLARPRQERVYGSFATPTYCVPAMWITGIGGGWLKSPLRYRKIATPGRLIASRIPAGQRDAKKRDRPAKGASNEKGGPRPPSTHRMDGRPVSRAASPRSRRPACPGISRLPVPVRKAGASRRRRPSSSCRRERRRAPRRCPSAPGRHRTAAR